jgi:hypothetical protein
MIVLLCAAQKIHTIHALSAWLILDAETSITETLDENNLSDVNE